MIFSYQLQYGLVIELKTSSGHTQSLLMIDPTLKASLGLYKPNTKPIIVINKDNINDLSITLKEE